METGQTFRISTLFALSWLFVLVVRTWFVQKLDTLNEPKDVKTSRLYWNLVKIRCVPSQRK